MFIKSFFTYLFKYKFRFILLGLLLAIIVSITCDYAISKNAKNKTFNNPSLIKKNKVGLVLGTSKFLDNGYINRYFKYRVEATALLYKNHKIDYVLVSGDNSTKDYDEPSDFKQELINHGIPANKIFLDYAGFRTLDSVVRAKKIFGQTNITIISQKFHNERAIYLAESNGMKAIGFNAKDVSIRAGIKTQIREHFARTKVFVDLIFGVQPKFLGKKIKI